MTDTSLPNAEVVPSLLEDYTALQHVHHALF
jgi:hypothetical protein